MQGDILNMENKILKALQSGAESVMMITTSQLREVVEYIMGEQRKYDERENLADKEQLRPAGYWVSKLGVDASTLWRWEKQGRIKATRLGSRVYYKASDFEKMKG